MLPKWLRERHRHLIGASNQQIAAIPSHVDQSACSRSDCDPVHKLREICQARISPTDRHSGHECDRRM